MVQAFGTCKGNLTSDAVTNGFKEFFSEDMFPGTDWPVRRYTPLHYTQPDESNTPQKSTRHLMSPGPRYYYERSGNLMRSGDPSYPNPDSDSNGSSENNLFGSELLYNTRGEDRDERLF